MVRMTLDDYVRLLRDCTAEAYPSMAKGTAHPGDLACHVAAVSAVLLACLDHDVWAGGGP